MDTEPISPSEDVERGLQGLQEDALEFDQDTSTTATGDDEVSYAAADELPADDTASPVSEDTDADEAAAAGGNGDLAQQPSPQATITSSSSVRSRSFPLPDDRLVEIEVDEEGDLVSWEGMGNEVLGLPPPPLVAAAGDVVRTADKILDGPADSSRRLAEPREGQEDISPDGSWGVLKTVLVPADGGGGGGSGQDGSSSSSASSDDQTDDDDEGDETPWPGDFVRVHYRLFNTRRDLLDASDGTEPFSFRLSSAGGGRRPDGWDVAVGSMKRGERSEFVLGPDWAFTAASPVAPPAAAWAPGVMAVVLELELVDFVGVCVNPEKDGGITMRTKTPGNGGGRPRDGSLVKVDLKGRHNGFVFDERYEEEFEIGDGADIDIPAGLEQALLHMEEGQVSRVYLGPAHGFGEQGHRQMLVPPAANEVRYDVKLVSFERVSRSEEAAGRESCQLAEEARRKGNRYFEKGLVGAAAARYRMVIEHAEKALDAASGRSQHGDGKAADTTSEAAVGRTALGLVDKLRDDAGIGVGRVDSREENDADDEDEDSVAPASYSSSSSSSSDDDEDFVSADELRRLATAGRLNLAACCLKLGRHSEAADLCTRLINSSEAAAAADGGGAVPPPPPAQAAVVKAHYRRGEARLAAGSLDTAAEDFRAVLSLEPGCLAARRRLADCRQLAREARAEDKRLAAAMLGVGPDKGFGSVELTSAAASAGYMLRNN